MAKRGSTKRSSLDHEDCIADLYGGVRSPSSGASPNDAGDVRTYDQLIECKTTGRPGYDPKPLPKFMQEFAKVADEAYGENRNPLLALRYYQPDHPLSNYGGWINVVVRRAEEDAQFQVQMELYRQESEEFYNDLRDCQYEREALEEELQDLRDLAKGERDGD